MKAGISWQYNEFKHVGTDYGSPAEVDIYDARHSDFRDLKAEALVILDALDKDDPVDAITTTFAFHHLPDFWKGIALERLHSMLKPGGRLYIHDVVMKESGALENIAELIDNHRISCDGPRNVILR